MKNLIILSLFLFTSISFSQTKTTTKCSADISCSQKYGTTVNEREYTLTVIFDEKELKFSTYENSKTMNTYNVTKKTDKYVIATNKENNYLFFDIKKKQLYYIDYYMNRYMTAGYGTQTTEIKQNAEKMIDFLKKGSTQKDVIQHLIKQTEYDF